MVLDVLPCSILGPTVTNLEEDDDMDDYKEDEDDEDEKDGWCSLL